MHSTLFLAGLFAVINVSIATPSANPMALPQTGTQFITGACQSDTDCASGCCAFNTGKCAGPVVAQQRDGGCGFGDAAPNANAAKALGSNIAAPGVAGGETGGAAAPGATGGETGGAAAPDTQAKAPAPAERGTQFITGAWKCAGPVVAQERDGGCGFGDTTPNDNAVGAQKRSFTA
ncbi:MAG: hypothetical protein Q9178_001128 [Gyalolechia marmorata]